MAYDEALSERVRALLTDVNQVTEKKMFGGLAFLVQGNMSLGVHRDELIVRLDPQAAVQALAERGTRVFDLSGRPMRGWLLVSADALREKKTLARWIKCAVKYAESLPAK